MVMGMDRGVRRGVPRGGEDGGKVSLRGGNGGNFRRGLRRDAVQRKTNIFGESDEPWESDVVPGTISGGGGDEKDGE